MQGWNKNLPATRLSQVIRNRDEYLRRAACYEPTGATHDEWNKYREWVNARRDDFKTAIEIAREEKRVNQRSKADERKRDRSPACRGK